MPAAGTHTREWTGFGEAEPNSLLRLAEVAIRVPDGRAAAASAEFIRQGLGVMTVKDALEGPLVVGASRFVFEANGAAESAPTPLPGQLYVWVEDIQRTWNACQQLEARLGRRIVEQAVCCADETRADALVLQDPGSETTFLVNQAPKGYGKRLVDASLCSAGENLLNLVDVMVRVPPGAIAEIEGFYRLQLSAAVSRTKEGCRVHFADGELLRQSITFSEDDGSALEDLRGHRICIYMPTVAKFRLALAKCAKADLLLPHGLDSAEALRRGEFMARMPQAAGALQHVIRSPVHPSYSSVGGA